MPVDEKSESPELVLYIDDVRVGTLARIEDNPVTCTAETDGAIPEGLEFGKGATLRFTVSAWKSCRTRKRFIKLMGGVFGVQPRDAEALAREAMRRGCESYGDLWADCFSYFTKAVIDQISFFRDAIIQAASPDGAPE